MPTARAGSQTRTQGFSSVWITATTPPAGTRSPTSNGSWSTTPPASGRMVRSSSRRWAWAMRALRSATTASTSSRALRARSSSWVLPTRDLASRSARRKPSMASSTLASAAASAAWAATSSASATSVSSRTTTSPAATRVPRPAGISTTHLGDRRRQLEGGALDGADELEDLAVAAAAGGERRRQQSQRRQRSRCGPNRFDMAAPPSTP